MTAYQTVVVGTDGSDSSFRAVERAAVIAADSGATLVITSAYQPRAGREVERAQDALGADVAYQVVGSAPAEESVRAAAERARKVGATSVETVVVAGDPVPALAKVVADRRADLLVVGNRGLNTLAGRILGSVPAEAARKAGVDVLIVHTT
ncbi:universal stress protein [Actinokineospora globicatena]|uniref:universal stress protein n=1 Tax=Actinokineospora globicatena TaxID=103729 RepID=UPI0020A4DBC3|nr:universal stress protein [Actinokineospora globicatena]MCP2305417.1 Nucleotide-binding universal stress protein, UspA family [Actinokineospora globicatena]GLW81283.1 universal stress protein [Actinokineospora globicatena]GLW88019.1 universal stress protein [Actinokineospora globicatena]